MLLLGRGFAERFPALRKDIRALTPERAAAYLRATGTPATVVEPDGLRTAVTADTLVVPDEEIMRELVDRHELQGVIFERTFLRWDRPWAQAEKPADYDGTVATDEVSRELTRLAVVEAQHSSDWWRQVGAVAVRDGKVLGTAYNRHHPTEYAPYLDGDPRNEFHRGLRPDLSTAQHAEAAIVARAAREGVSLAGADLYVSTFPCPACARLVAEAGFTRCYFAGPYAMLDGDGVLRAAGVELIWVDLSPGAGGSS
ncbi:deaminase [Planosporangium thailandense]|uniref:deaminase n=1 Tax=Planosporangium thailandense TaxID=765197 RepID=UPI00197B1C50